MVLVGQVQREIVGLVNAHGPFAVGLSGEDAHLFTAEPHHLEVDGERVDLGLVGDVVEVDPGVVQGLVADGRIPVVSSVARGTGGEVYNVNADTAAAALAVALGAEKLVVLTDVEGLYGDWPTDGTTPTPDDVISSITADELEAMLPSLSTGMVPEDGRLPARRARGRAQGARASTAGCRTRCSSRCSPTRASAPRCHCDRRRLVADVDAADVRRADADPGARRRRDGLGRRRQRLRRPGRRHRGQRARPRAPGGRRGGHRAGRDPRATPRTWSPTSRRCGSPSGCSP